MSGIDAKDELLRDIEAALYRCCTRDVPPNAEPVCVRFDKTFPAHAAVREALVAIEKARTQGVRW